ncbi:hypothetical protein VDGL01_11586 [Verticillium dahliae]
MAAEPPLSSEWSLGESRAKTSTVPAVTCQASPYLALPRTSSAAQPRIFEPAEEHRRGPQQESPQRTAPARRWGGTEETERHHSAPASVNYSSSRMAIGFSIAAITANGRTMYGALPESTKGLNTASRIMSSVSDEITSVEPPTWLIQQTIFTCPNPDESTPPSELRTGRRGLLHKPAIPVTGRPLLAVRPAPIHRQIVALVYAQSLWPAVLPRTHLGPDFTRGTSPSCLLILALQAVETWPGGCRRRWKDGYHAQSRSRSKFQHQQLSHLHATHPKGGSKLVPCQPLQQVPGVSVRCPDASRSRRLARLRSNIAPSPHLLRRP